MSDSSKALFFGRAGCAKSDLALAFLETAGFQTEVEFSQTPGTKLPARVHSWRGDWIFCFRSYYILPQSVIDSAKQGAINFHPAPSNYRGRGCLNFALYNNAQEYGVTTHMVEAKVDSGPILRCDRFPIFSGDGVDSLLQRTHHYLLSAFYHTVGGITREGRAHVDTLLKTCRATWSGPLYKLSDLNALQILDPGVTPEEMDRVVRATHCADYPTQLEIHGMRFAFNRKVVP